MYNSNNISNFVKQLKIILLIKIYQVMDKSFIFTGLSWMTPENITQMNQSLSVLEKYGINHKFEQNKGRLTITGYTDVLQSRDNDDDVTFLHKFQGYYGDEIHEDTLLIFTITEYMEIKAQVLNYLGNIEPIK